MRDSSLALRLPQTGPCTFTSAVWCQSELWCTHDVIPRCQPCLKCSPGATHYNTEARVCKSDDDDGDIFAAKIRCRVFISFTHGTSLGRVFFIYFLSLGLYLVTIQLALISKGISVLVTSLAFTKVFFLTKLNYIFIFLYIFFCISHWNLCSQGSFLVTSILIDEYITLRQTSQYFHEHIVVKTMRQPYWLFTVS